MKLNHTPASNRLHIGLYGQRNSGKSSLINAITNQKIATVSDTPGTTTDLVQKSMEIHPIGPVLFIDTPGFDDEGTLGALRIKQTLRAIEKTDVALFICNEQSLGNAQEKEWIEKLKRKNIPIVLLINKVDCIKNATLLAAEIEKQYRIKPLLVSAKNREGIDNIINAISEQIPEDFNKKDITQNLVHEGDLVLLVMPQDIQAPKGRLILPQVQTLRELLDKKCLVMSCTTDKLKETIEALNQPPKLIITDSQVFNQVYSLKPEKSLLTSFSVLFAAQKGDINFFVESAKKIEQLTTESKVLIAEACTHVPLQEDIGRIKIPNLLRKKVGEALSIDVVAGHNFPEDLSQYDLIIHCAGCMFNRAYVMSRLRKAEEQGIPMTNYGITIAYLNGILDKITY